ncbi:MAG: lipid-A-disaccharide synthase, partial [Alphaproteobacteria bacterium]|nr:lipid-A-disaccharide synthase [Alphaproteobacteria bacterium]
MTAPIFIIAGEASGDQLAAHLMRAVNAAYDRPEWIGVGGRLMQNEGLTASLQDINALSVMGFGSAVIAYPRLSRLADDLVDAVMKARPRLVLTVDNKGFAIRFAARLKRRMKAAGWSAPIVHCVAPTVWAWGGWRAKKFAAIMDGLLCLFPFEPDYFTPLGLDAHFIGHPEAFGDFLPIKQVVKSKNSAPRIILLPGSRHSEITLILPEMLVAAAIIKTHEPAAEFVLPAVPNLLPLIRDFTAGRTITVLDQPQDLIPALQTSDAMIAASGTVTLQAALCGTVGVTCYRTGRISGFIGRRLVDFDKVILPNAILGRPVYPFYFQEAATGKNLATAVLDCLADGNAKARGR